MALGRDERIQELDLMRFAAAVAVMVYHRARDDVTMFGFLGVHLFFMVSGFVILWTAMKKTPWQFVASRLARLYPSFWACLAITSCLVAASGARLPLKELMANFTMVPAEFHQPLVDGVYWTLLLEMKFYVLVLVLLLTGQLRRIEMALGVWVAVCAIQALPFASSWRLFNLDGYGPLFITGCYMYLLRSGQASRYTRYMAAASFTLAVLQGVRGEAGFTHDRDLWVEVTVVAVMMMEGGLLYALAVRAWHLPTLRIWSTLGAMTYPLYLIHDKAGNVLSEWLQGWAGGLQQAVVMGLSLVLALALAVSIERRVCATCYRWLTTRTQRPRMQEA